MRALDTRVHVRILIPPRQLLACLLACLSAPGSLAAACARRGLVLLCPTSRILTYIHVRHATNARKQVTDSPISSLMRLCYFPDVSDFA